MSGTASHNEPGAPAVPEGLSEPRPTTAGRTEPPASVAGGPVHAALLASAMGDSLGAAVEFSSLTEIVSRLGPRPTRPLPAYGMDLPITDDTQMTLFTAEGLLEGLAVGDLVGCVHDALLHWYGTQGGHRHWPHAKAGRTLAADERLHRMCAPGNTCLAALRSASRGQPATNDSKGCGTIMRVAPVAFAVPRDRVHAVASATSALTHGHPTGQIAAAAWAEMLADVHAGAPVAEAAAMARDRCAGPAAAETRQAIVAALAAAGADPEGEPSTVERLGSGWTAEDALSIALYAALVASDLGHGLAVSVTHSGDSDSTGAVAGAMLGLRFPEEVFAVPWGAGIECGDLIAAIASRLAAVCAAHAGPQAKAR